MDGITSDGVISITLSSGTAAWQYSLDGGATWTAGVGTSFALSSGSYDKNNIVVKQTDAANNTSVSTMGSMVQLEALGNTTGSDQAPQITSVGTTGEYVVTFQGSEGTDDSIYVQKFNANGTVQGIMVQLEAIGNTMGSDYNPQITAVGTTGAYVVTFQGVDTIGNWSVFVQKFDVNGAVIGAMVQLEALNNTAGSDLDPK
ncbi:hypothetical protein JZU71_04650, partial [bacterium]|nr:hypothetical protein [bacterium]